MYTELIDYFHKGIATGDGMKKIDFAKINAKAVLLGYVIHPDCCNEFVNDWLDTLTANYNATFYKEWNEVVGRNRFELFVDQLLHYATTYGTDFEFGNGFVPNDGASVPPFKELKVIEPANVNEFCRRCFDVLKSGIALKDSTMKVLCDFYRENAIDGMDCSDDQLADVLSQIKNKEAMCYLSHELGLLPNDEFGILRCLVHEYTGKFLLIKSKDVLDQIKTMALSMGVDAPILKLTERQIRILSRIFLRFKPLFLAMKTKSTARVVNKLRRLAKKNHRPFQIGFWENIVSEPRPITEVCMRLVELDNFRKVRLLMLVKERLNFETNTGVFPIRNGKLFVRENYEPKYDLGYLKALYSAIRASLVNSLAKKACKVRLPENCNLALPTSEKTFVGNFPFGTSFNLSENNIIGVYWRNEWGTRDFDLSMADFGGRLISWRGSYYNDNTSVVFSGDMTNADPEAVELLYIKDSTPDGIVMLNKFRGCDESKFRFFYANEVLDVMNMENHMVDPNNIKFDTMIDFDGQGQKTIGVVFENKFVFMDFKSGGNRASSAGKYVNVVVDAMKRRAACFVYLKDILADAGFTFAGDDETPDIDFSNLEKDTFIKLLSVEEN